MFDITMSSSPTAGKGPQLPAQIPPHILREASSMGQVSCQLAYSSTIAEEADKKLIPALSVKSGQHCVEPVAPLDAAGNCAALPRAASEFSSLERDRDLTSSSSASCDGQSMAALQANDIDAEFGVYKPLLQSLRELALAEPNALCLAWLNKECEVEASFTRGRLWHLSGALGQELVEKYELKRGDRAIIMYEPGIDFMVAFLACLRVGVIVVSPYPPNIARLQSEIPKFALYVKDSTPKFCLTTRKFLNVVNISSMINQWPKGLRWIVTDNYPAQTPSTPQTFATDVNLGSEDLAFLQYTSGSTGEPKGVMVSHGNLWHQVQTGRSCYPLDLRDDPKNCHYVGWVPQYHDMGLIAFLMSPLTGGVGHHFSPLTFLQDPTLWPRAIEKYRGTLTNGPDFSLALTAKRLQSKGLRYDCSSIRIIAQGGEPARPASIFAAAEAFGIPLDRFRNAYGLAEHVLLISWEGAFLHNSRTISAGNIVFSKKRMMDIRIVEEKDGALQEVPEGVCGEVLVSSPCVCKGYWEKKELSEATFRAKIVGIQDRTFLRTGDQGYLEGETLYVTSRLKDLIILNGKNYYPGDVEKSAEVAFPDKIRPGCSIAFQTEDSGHLQGMTPPYDGQQGITLVCEVRQSSSKWADIKEMADRVVRHVRVDQKAPVNKLVFVRPGTVLKTTSGKVKRKATSAAVKEGRMISKTLLVWEDYNPELEESTHGCESHFDVCRFQSLSLEEQRHEVAVTVLGLFAAATGLPNATLDSSPAELGVDSVTFTQFQNRVRSQMGGVVVPSSCLLHCISVEELADEILQLLASRYSASNQAMASECISGHNASSLESVEVTSQAGKNDLAAKSPSPAGVGKLPSGVIEHTLQVIIHLMCHGAVLCLLSCCMFLFGLVFEVFVPGHVFQGLRIYRFSIKPSIHTYVDHHPRVEASYFRNEALLSNIYVATVTAVLTGGAAIICLLVTVSVLSKWLILGRVKCGTYPKGGFFYWRRWFVSQLVGTTLAILSVVCPYGNILAYFYRCLGAKVGKRSSISCLIQNDWDLISMGDDCSVSGSSQLVTGLVIESSLHLRAISLGEGCKLADRAVLMQGIMLPPKTLVREHSVVHVSPAEALDGVVLKGKPAEVVQYETFEGNQASGALDTLVLPICWLLSQSLVFGACVCLVVLVDQTVFGSVHVHGLILCLLALLYVGIFLLGLCIFTVILKWALLGRLRVGQAIDKQLEVCREIVHNFSALCFRFVFSKAGFGPLLNWWYCLLGAKIHTSAVISTGVDLRDFDTIVIGPRALIGGGVIFQTTIMSDEGIEVIEGFTLCSNSIIGANSTIGAGSWVGRHGLVSMRSNLQSREVLPDFAVVSAGKVIQKLKRVYQPSVSSRKEFLLRLFTTVCQMLIHGACVALALHSSLWAAWACDQGGLHILLMVPILLFSFNLSLVVLFVVFKWILIGKYTAGTYSLSCMFGVRYLIASNLNVQVLGFNPLSQWIRGGPCQNLLLKALGAKVSMSTYINTLWIYEFDLLELRPYCAINEGVSLVPHLINDMHTMTLDQAVVNELATCWPECHVLGGQTLKSGMHLGPESRMGSEVLCPSDHTGVHMWIGAPATLCALDPLDEALPAVRTPEDMV